LPYISVKGGTLTIVHRTSKIGHQNIQQRHWSKYTCKSFGESGQEYRRVSQNIKGRKGQSKYLDFIFDKGTNITGKGETVTW